MKFKFKNIVLATILGLTSLIGIGNAILLGQGKESGTIKKADAATTKVLYFKDKTWWSNNDYEKTYMYLWQSTNENNNNGWPGKQMEEPSPFSTTSSNVYTCSYDADLGYDRVIFSRHNGTKVDAQTADLTIPTNGNNLCSLTSDSAQWKGDSDVKASSSWSTRGKADWYLVGTGSFAPSSSWSTPANGVQFLDNTSNPNDQGVLTHQYLQAGDVFKVRKSSNTWLKRSDVDSTGLNKPAFSTAVTNNALFTVTDWTAASRNGFYNGTSETYSSAEVETDNMTIYVNTNNSSVATYCNYFKIKTWYSGDHWYTGTRISGTQYNVNAIYRFTIPIQQLNNGFSIFRNNRGDNQDKDETYIGSFNGGFYDPSYYVNKTNYYDFYITNSGTKLYIKNSEDSSKGYLYLSQYPGTNTSYNRSAAVGGIYIYSWDGSNNKITGTTWPGLKYEYIYGHMSNKLKFDTRGGLIKIPLSCLNGATKFVYTIFDSSGYTGDSHQLWKSNDFTLASDMTKDYYINIDASEGTLNTTHGPAARVAYDIDHAIAGADNASICNIDPEQISDLVSDYNSVSTKTKLVAATVTTYTSTKPTYTGSHDWTMAELKVQLDKLDPNTSGSMGLFKGFTLFGGEDNFSTIIIIISSSVALLSVTALSILVITKRKSKEIE